jgi:hypothetical protein
MFVLSVDFQNKKTIIVININISAKNVALESNIKIIKTDIITVIKSSQRFQFLKCKIPSIKNGNLTFSDAENILMLPVFPFNNVTALSNGSNLVCCIK